MLSPGEVRTYYRFFGARHSILQLGNLIDFEVEGENGRFLPRLRALSHLGFSWQFDKNRLLVWHNFISLFEAHLKETEMIEGFYYELLLQAAKKWEKQNPKRLVCESYMQLLAHEGRVHREDCCYICEAPLGEEISLMRAFIPAHPACLYASALSREKVERFFETKQTLHLEDDEVDYLFSIVMKGL